MKKLSDIRYIPHILHIVLKSFAVLGVLIIPLSFVMGQRLIVPILDSVLHLKVDPRFSGGELREEILDDFGDENGAGTLTYPVHESFAGSGYLDMVGYSVFGPETDPAWSGSGAFWQLGVSFADMANPMGYESGFSHPALRIYIDLDGTAGGSVEGADARCELASFDPAHPWDLAVTLDGAHKDARLRSADGKIDRTIKMIPVPEKKTIYIRIPLDSPQTKKILEGGASWHYVMAGAYDPYAPGSFMAVKEQASAGSGGGAVSRLTPKIYDYLCPETKPQSELLSDYSEEDFSYAVLYPVEVTGKASGAAIRLVSEGLETLKAEKEKEAKERKEGRKAELAEALSSEDPFVRAEVLFGSGKTAEAKAAFELIKGQNPAAMAYLGSLAAMEGGKTKSPAEAIRRVQEGYALLDEAVRAAREKYESDPSTAQIYLVCLLNRAEVSRGVPEEVFEKSRQGSKDYEDAAGVSLGMGKPRDAGDYYVAAAACLERTGDKEGAKILLLKARSIKGLSASTRYELAKRGIYVK